MTTSTINPQAVCRAIRRIRKQQMTDSTISTEISRFIKAEGLMEETHWPGFVVHITRKGCDYLNEHEGE